MAGRSSEAVERGRSCQNDVEVSGRSPGQVGISSADIRDISRGSEGASAVRPGRVGGSLAPGFRVWGLPTRPGGWRRETVRSVAAALQCLSRGSCAGTGGAGLERGCHL